MELSRLTKDYIHARKIGHPSEMLIRRLLRRGLLDTGVMIVGTTGGIADATSNFLPNVNLDFLGQHIDTPSLIVYASIVVGFLSIRRLVQSNNVRYFGDN